MNNPTNSTDYYCAILDAMPLPVFVVDEDLQIFDFNEAAGRLLAADRTQILRRRSGEAMHCIHSSPGGGCGKSEACRSCVIRQSVQQTYQGAKITREKTRMQLQTEKGIVEVQMLVTAVPIDLGGVRRSLLILENITELVALRELIPICCRCKAIRDDQRYWHRLENYMREHLHVDCSHGMCPKCTVELYPDLAEEVNAFGPRETVAAAMI